MMVPSVHPEGAMRGISSVHFEFASLTAGRSVVPCVGFKTWQQHPRTQYRGWCNGRASVRTSRPNLCALGMSQLPSGLEILHMSQVGVTPSHAAPLLKPLGRLRLLTLHEVELDSSDIETDLRPLCSNDGLIIQLCGALALPECRQSPLERTFRRGAATSR